MGEHVAPVATPDVTHGPVYVTETAVCLHCELNVERITGTIRKGGEREEWSRPMAWVHQRTGEVPCHPVQLELHRQRAARLAAGRLAMFATDK